MSDYELTIEFESAGIKRTEVSDDQLARWLDQTATELRQGTAEDVNRFKVEKL